MRKTKQYECPWCQYEFKAEAQYTESGRGGSNQIKCPNCHRFVPTWERTKGVSGRK